MLVATGIYWDPLDPHWGNLGVAVANLNHAGSNWEEVGVTGTCCGQEGYTERDWESLGSYWE